MPKVRIVDWGSVAKSQLEKIEAALASEQDTATGLS